MRLLLLLLVTCSCYSGGVKVAGGTPSAQQAQWFQQAGAAAHIPASVLAGIASVESNLGANTGPSSTGARGLMQFEPGTAAGLGVNVNDPRSEVFGAAKLLNQYGYQQNPTRAIAAYNAGPGNYQAGLGYAQQVTSEARRLSGQLAGGTAATATGPAASASGGSLTVQVPYQTQSFDQAGYNQARAKFIAGTAVKATEGNSNPYSSVAGASKGFASSLGPDSSALFAKGLLTTSAPSPASYTSTQTKNLTFATSELQKMAGTPLVNVHGGAAGDVNPIPGAVIGRTDMGVDANLKPGAPILAPNNAKVVGISPNWYKGQPYIAVQLTSGANAGKVMYVAEQVTPSVKVGQTLQRGQAIGTYAPSGTGIEIGWANPRNWSQTLAQATTGYAEGEQTKAGTNFRSYLGGL